MRFTSPPRLHHLPYWTFHPYSHTSSYLKNKSIIQQQHSHSMVFVIFSIEFTQNKNKTCLRIFTVMLFDQQLQPQIILWWNCQNYFKRNGMGQFKSASKFVWIQNFWGWQQTSKEFSTPSPAHGKFKLCGNISLKVWLDTTQTPNLRLLIKENFLVYRRQNISTS